MNRDNPHFKFLLYSNQIMLIMWFVMVIVVTGTNVIFRTPYEGDTITYMSSVNAYSIMLCLFGGIRYSLSLFSGAMNIRADRNSFIKSFLASTLVVSVVMSVVGISIDSVFKFILEILENKEVVMLDATNWVDVVNETNNLDSMGVISITIQRLLSNILAISSGFSLGAIIYRLKIKSNIILFVGVPSLGLIYIVNQFLKNFDRFTQCIRQFGEVIVYIVSNPPIFTSVKIVAIFVLISIGILLLRKAPIKEYAHDLV